MTAFLDGRVVLHAGDCLDVLATMDENSVDSVVCDPPYHLTSIVKRFGAEGAAEATGGVYKRSGAGFMGKQWDGGDIAFQPSTWAAVLRVLKPGAHLLAFASTRGYHRMACAIEDGGFEIRDQIGWAYGSGFPKNHDVSKSIDKRGGQKVAWFGAWLKAWRLETGTKQSQVAALFPSKSGGTTGCVANWELGLNMPTPEQFNLICSTFGLPFADMAEAERAVVGEGYRVRRDSVVNLAGASDGVYDITAPGSDEARDWQGWGTALKPAWEPICLARKPLEGTIAENVLGHGTGAINIDGARVPGEGGGLGRWPANILHDGSAEVLAAFPAEAGAFAAVRGTEPSNAVTNVYGARERTATLHHGVSGSAARFFYSAKADAEDRLGSKHPTVKPLDLMQYLVRLVTPPGGTVLDCFAGTGATGEAAWREGMRAVLIEREPEYQADIARRMELAENPTKRAAVAKSKNNLQGAEGTPLFGGEAA